MKYIKDAFIAFMEGMEYAGKKYHNALLVIVVIAVVLALARVIFEGMY